MKIHCVRRGQGRRGRHDPSYVLCEERVNAQPAFHLQHVILRILEHHLHTVVISLIVNALHVVVHLERNFLQPLLFVLIGFSILLEATCQLQFGWINSLESSVATLFLRLSLALSFLLQTGVRLKHC